MALNNLWIFLAITTTWYSTEHYADGGCDGGLCGLAMIFHALPALFA